MSSGKRKTSKIDLYYKPERRGYKEVVHFTAAETDVTKIPTAEERNKNVVDQSILRKRLIFTNDPLPHQMESQTIGSDVEVIRYTLLRTLDCKRPPDEIADFIEDKLKEQPTKKPRVLCNPEKQPRVRRAINVRSPAELLQLHCDNCIVPLTVVPNRNGNLEKDRIGIFYDETYRMEPLFFNCE